MKLTLLTKIINEFYRLNRIPVFILKGEKIVFKTLSDEFVSEQALRFLCGLNELSAVTIYGGIEYYASFPYSSCKNNYKIIAGPVFAAHPINVGYRGGLAVSKIIKPDRFKDFILSVSVTGEENFSGYISVLSEITGNGNLDYKNLEPRNISLESEIDKKLTEFVFSTRENLLSPYAPETEQRIMETVKSGGIEELKKINTAFAADAPGRNVPYKFKVVSLVTLCTRAVLECGVDATIAYGLSDQYLEKLGKTTDDRQTADIAKNILPHFASLVSGRKETDSEKYSPHIVNAQKYIRTHLHYKISLKETADAVGVSEKYLSRLFVTHKGVKFSDYVNKQRIIEAKDLLLNTNLPISEISYSVGFFSESYFIKIFRENCSMTPYLYRSRYSGK